MKRKIFALAAAFIVFGAAEGYSIGLGLQFGSGGSFGNWSSFGGNVSFLLSTANNSHWALSYNLAKEGFGFGLTYDYWLFTPKLTNVGKGDLNFFAGVGAYLNLATYGNFDIDIGIRVPLGIDLKIEKIDVYLQVAPAVELNITPSPGFGGGTGSGAIGIRLWI